MQLTLEAWPESTRDRMLHPVLELYAVECLLGCSRKAKVWLTHPEPSPDMEVRLGGWTAWLGAGGVGFGLHWFGGVGWGA